MRTGPPPMRQLTSISRGPRLVYFSSTWNTPCSIRRQEWALWAAAACQQAAQAQRQQAAARCREPWSLEQPGLSGPPCTRGRDAGPAAALAGRQAKNHPNHMYFLLLNIE